MLAASNRNVVGSTALITAAATLLTLGYEPAQVAVKVFPRRRAGTN
jgi:hypothetical protein